MTQSETLQAIYELIECFNDIDQLFSSYFQYAFETKYDCVNITK